MKKALVIMVLVALTVTLLAGCAAEPNKTGLGSYLSIAKSKSATAEAAGRGQADCTFAAVTVDKDGKVVAVSIDTAQVRIEFDATGVVTTDLEAALKTKVELGDDYGMIANSELGKEWYQQIASLEAWMIGKTSAEIEAIDTETDADLMTSVSITVDPYVAAVLEAIENAK